MGVMDPLMRDVRGAGWMLYERDRFVCLKFNHKPCSTTLQRLNSSRLTYSQVHRVWFAGFATDTWMEALAIAEAAETWESVGEHPWSPYEDMPQPGLGYDD